MIAFLGEIMWAILVFIAEGIGECAVGCLIIRWRDADNRRGGHQ